MIDPTCYVCGETLEDCECGCTCEFVGDMQFAKWCPVHGDGGIVERKLKQLEAFEDAAFWAEVAEF